MKKCGKLFVYLDTLSCSIKSTMRDLKIKRRAWHIKQLTDISIGDKLRTLAAKADAIEKYYNDYCNPDRIGRLEAHRNKKWYNKHKNELKKELLLLNYNY